MNHVTTTMLPDSEAAEQVLSSLGDLNIPDDAIAIVARGNNRFNNHSKQVSMHFSNESTNHVANDTDNLGVTINMANLSMFNAETLGIAGTGPVSAIMTSSQLDQTMNDPHAVLTSFGISEEQMPTIEHAIAEGGVLVSVMTNDNTAGIVESTFREHHGRFIKST
ncbi:MAG: hypothetical protein ACF8OB_19730 [Phycisphaeraceae bacterium JB051]